MVNVSDEKVFNTFFTKIIIIILWLIFMKLPSFWKDWIWTVIAWLTYFRSARLFIHLSLELKPWISILLCRWLSKSTRKQTAPNPYSVIQLSSSTSIVIEKVDAGRQAMNANGYLLQDIWYLEFVPKSLIIRRYYQCVLPYCNSTLVV